MGEMYLSCPHCNIELACDEQEAGQQMQCPSCQGWIIAPAAPPPPSPPRAQTQIRSGGAPHRNPSRKKKRKRSAKKADRSESTVKFIKITVAVVVFGIAFYFAFGFARSWQQSFNKERHKAEKESGGGQLGHIADLYDVLEMTDPTNMEGMFVPAGGPSGRMDDYGQEQTAEHTSSRAAEVLGLPAITPAWTLDIEAAKIENGRACGRIAGTNFVAEVARIVPAGDSHILSLRQGAEVLPDQEVLIYLRLAPGEEMQGQKWTISPDMKGKTVPQVVKRWRKDPRYAPWQKVYYGGYAMKLELIQSDNEGTLGKVFVALPDDDQTVVAGVFYAQAVRPSRTGFGDADY